MKFDQLKYILIQNLSVLSLSALRFVWIWSLWGQLEGSELGKRKVRAHANSSSYVTNHAIAKYQILINWNPYPVFIIYRPKRDKENQSTTRSIKEITAGKKNQHLLHWITLRIGSWPKVFLFFYGGGCGESLSFESFLRILGVFTYIIKKGDNEMSYEMHATTITRLPGSVHWVFLGLWVFLGISFLENVKCMGNVTCKKQPF